MSTDKFALELISKRKINKLGDLAKHLGFDVWWGPGEASARARGVTGGVLQRLKRQGLIYICSKPHMIRLTAKGREALKGE